METRLVYRVEHAERDTGPFDLEGAWTLHEVMADAGEVEPDADEAYHCASRGFPGPSNDARLSRRWFRGDLDDYAFGCPSERALARWFPKPMADYLHERGFVVTVWEVPRRCLAFGKGQVMFDRDLAELVEARPVTSLHEEAA